MYGIVSEIHHTCCVHFCMYEIFTSRSNKYSLILLYDEQIWCSYVSEISSSVISLLEWLLLPHINIVILFLVVEMGSNLIPCHFTKYVFQSFWNTEMTCTKKLIMHRHIAIRNFISVLIWEHIVYLIFL